MSNKKSLVEFVFELIKPFRFHFLASALICMLISSYPSINASILKSVIDISSNFDFSSNESLLVKLLPNILYYILTYFLLNIGWRVVEQINMNNYPYLKSYVIENMFGELIHQDIQFYQNNFAGAVASKISDMQNAIQKFFFTLNEIIFWKLSMTLIAGIALFLVNPFFTLIFFSWITVFILFNWLVSKNIVFYSSNFTEASAKARGKVLDIFTNIFNVKIFARENYEKSTVKSILTEVTLTHKKLYRRQQTIRFVQGVIVSTMNVTFLIYLIYLYQEGKVTVGDFVLTTKLSTDIVNRLWDITSDLNILIEEYGKIKQAHKLMTLPINIKDKENAKILKLEDNIDCDIKFDNISFSYHKKAKVFNDLNLEIKANSKVGLVGYSGSGKSTFVNLLNRFYDCDEGGILINSHDIKDISQESLHNLISFIPQDPILFHRSLYDNIAYGDVSATKEQVIEAAKKAYAHEFIVNTPEGYDSLVGERGLKLSGGQRQRIAIARAFLKNSPILILDEATSALDSSTELYIQKSLAELIKDKTVITIAHRLSTLLMMERILVFKNGEIIQDGSHNELMEHEGVYKELWNTQAKGFL